MTPLKDSYQNDLDMLLSRIASRDFMVGIMGMGYVGLPLAPVAAKSSSRVIGVDIDETRVALLNRDENSIKHVPSSKIAEALAEKCFRVTADPNELGEPYAIRI